MEKTATKKDRIYQAVIALMGVIIVILLWQLLSVRTEIRTVYVEKERVTNELESELQELLFEHEQIKKEYGELSLQLTEKDSIIQASATEIERLIASQADSRQVKRKLDYLRGITQGYINQIDSLFKVNAELKDENVKIRGQIKQEKTRSEVLVREKDELAEKVEIAAMLKAYNLSAQGVYGKGRNEREEGTDKARRVEKIKICFTLSQNLIIPSGEKTIYCRIARPDNQILVKGKGDLYTFVFSGELMQYSIKKTINYRNAEQLVCLYWDKEDDKTPAMTGTYNVAVFVDGYEIGQTSFTLK
jgi:hypothetical protein